MKFHITVLPKNSIMVQPHGSNDIDEYSFNSLHSYETKIINDWITENNAGYRLSWQTWQLNDDKSLSLFLLKWA